MQNNKKPLLFYFKSNFIIITIFFIIFSIYSCDQPVKRYIKIIHEYSADFGVKPTLVFAIADIESHFNARAKSDAGAIGIMQIMPETGKWIATRIGINDFSDNSLYDAKINLKIGIWYLSYLLSKFDEEWQAIAAYNAGEGRVQTWITTQSLSRDNIPFPETKAYVAKVEKAIVRYSKKKYAAFN